MAGLIGMRF